MIKGVWVLFSPQSSCTSLTSCEHLHTLIEPYLLVQWAQKMPPTLLPAGLWLCRSHSPGMHPPALLSILMYRPPVSAGSLDTLPLVGKQCEW